MIFKYETFVTIDNEIDSALIKRRNFMVKLLHERQDCNIINAE